MLRNVATVRDLTDVPPAVSPTIEQMAAELRGRSDISMRSPIVEQCQRTPLNGAMRVAPMDMYAVLLHVGYPPYRALSTVARWCNYAINDANYDANRRAHDPVYLMQHGMRPYGPRTPDASPRVSLPGPLSWRYVPRPRDRRLLEAALHPPIVAQSDDAPDIAVE